jgi:hypothetical protein
LILQLNIRPLLHLLTRLLRLFRQRFKCFKRQVFQRQVFQRQVFQRQVFQRQMFQRQVF